MDVKTLCLGILALGDATGYEIKKLVADGAFSLFSEASYGSIYPALTKMMNEGLVTCRTERQDGKPDKKIYALTNAGRAQLQSNIQHTPGPDRQRSEFLAALLFAEAVSPERIGALLKDRSQQHSARIKALEAMLDDEMTPAARFVLEYGLAIQRAALNHLEDNQDALMDQQALSGHDA